MGKESVGTDEAKAGEAQWEVFETDSIASDGQEQTGGRKSSWYTLSKGSATSVTNLRARAKSADAGGRGKSGDEKRKGRSRGSAHSRRTASLSAERRQHGLQQRTIVRSTKVIRRDSSHTNITTSNSEANDNASNDSNEEENLRRLYEQQLDGVDDDDDDDVNHQHALVQVESTNRRALSGKMYRIRGNGQMRRSRRHSSPGSTSAAPVFYPTTPLRYRYKREFHGYKYQSSNRSIIAPPLSLRTTVNYDKVPVLFRCDSVPKRQISLLMTDESGFHSHASTAKPHNSHIHGPATITAVSTTGTGTMTEGSRSKTFIKYQTQKPPRGPRRPQRHVRIQCNLLPSDAGTGTTGITSTDQRQLQNVKFAAKLVTTPVEKRSVAVQHDTLPPKPKLTVEMMNVDVSAASTQTDVKTYAHRGDNTTELFHNNKLDKSKHIDSSVQCTATMSSVGVQSLQANVKNTATQSDAIAPPPPSRPIVQQKDAGTQSIPEPVEKAKPQLVLKEKPGPKKTFRDASTEPWVVPMPPAAAVPVKAATAVKVATPVRAAPTAPAAINPELMFQQTAQTPRIEMPLEFDIPMNGPLPRPRPDIYFYQAQKEQELIRLHQKENNPPKNARRIRSAGDQAPMLRQRHTDNRATHRGMRQKPANLRYQGLYRILSS